jgi:hypothetical protein
VTLLPECLDDWVDESNPVRVVDAFVDALDLKQLSFDGMVPKVTRAAFLPSISAAEALHLRLSQPHSVEPSSRARGEAIAHRAYCIRFRKGWAMPGDRKFAQNTASERKPIARG